MAHVTMWSMSPEWLRRTGQNNKTFTFSPWSLSLVFVRFFFSCISSSYLICCFKGFLLLSSSYLQCNPTSNNPTSRPPSQQIMPPLIESQPSSRASALSRSESLKRVTEESAQICKKSAKEQSAEENENRGFPLRERIRNNALSSNSGAQELLDQSESLECLRQNGKQTNLFCNRSHNYLTNLANEQIPGENRNRNFHSDDNKMINSKPSSLGAQRSLNRSESLECFRRSDKWSGLSRKRSHSSNDMQSHLRDKSTGENFEKSQVDNEMVVYSSENVILIKEPRRNKRKNVSEEQLTADNQDHSNTRQDVGQVLNFNDSNLGCDGELNNASTNQVTMDHELRIESNHQLNHQPNHQSNHQLIHKSIQNHESNYKSSNHSYQNMELTENSALRNWTAMKHDAEKQTIVNASYEESRRTSKQFSSKQFSRERSKEHKNVTAALHALGKHVNGEINSLDGENFAPSKRVDEIARGLKLPSKNLGTFLDSDGVKLPYRNSNQIQLADMHVQRKMEKLTNFDEKEFTSNDYDNSDKYFKGQNLDGAEIKTGAIAEVSCLPRDSNVDRSKDSSHLHERSTDIGHLHERSKDIGHLHERSKDIGHHHERSKDIGHLHEEVKDKSRVQDHSPKMKNEDSRSKHFHSISTDEIALRLKNMAKRTGFISAANENLPGTCEENTFKSVSASFCDTNGFKSNMSDQTMCSRNTNWLEKPGDFSNGTMPSALKNNNGGGGIERTGQLHTKEHDSRGVKRGTPAAFQIESNAPNSKREKLTDGRVENTPNNQPPAKLSKRERKKEVSPEKGLPIDYFQNVCGRLEPTAVEMMKYLTTIHQGGNDAICSTASSKQRESEMPRRPPGLPEGLPIASGLHLPTQSLEGTLSSQLLNGELEMSQAIAPRLPLLSWPSPDLSLFNRRMLTPSGPVLPVPQQSPGDKKFLSPGIPLPLAYQLQQLNQWNMFRQELLGSPMIPELNSFSSQLNEG